MKKYINAGKHVLYRTPFLTRETGCIKIPASNPDFVLIAPDNGATLQLVHKRDIISIA